MNKDIEILEHLYYMVSMQKFSIQASKDDTLHDEIVKYIDFICNTYHYSNFTINQVLNIAESFSVFKYNFKNLIKDLTIIKNNSYKYSITLN